MLKKIPNINFFLWLFFYLAIFSFALNQSLTYMDHDFPWHLKIGEQIAEEKAAPSVDYYNHPILGQSFVDHEWLFNYLFFQIYDKFGHIFLNIIFAALVTLTFFILKKFTQIFFLKIPLQRSKDNSYLFNSDTGLFFIMALSAYGVLTIKPFIGLRMQIAGNLLFLLVLLLLEYFNQTGKRKFLIWLIPLFIFWANLHGSFLIGLFALWAFVSLKTISPVLKKLKIFSFFEFNILEKKSLFNLYLFSILATLATTLNPYGFGLYGFLKDYGNTFYMSVINEWLPFYFYPLIYHHFVYAALFLLMVIISFHQFSKNQALVFGFNKYIKQISPWYLFLSFLFFVLSLKSKRHLPLFVIASLPLLIQFLYFEFTTEIKHKFNAKLILWLKYFFVAVFVATSFFFLSRAHFNNNPFDYRENSPMPYQISQYLINNPDLDSKKIFNSYSWGGYFLWTVPDRLLFIDGRMPQYQYENHSFLEEYLEFFDKEKIQEKIDKHQIELMVLQKDPPFSFGFLEKMLFSSNEEKLNNNKNDLYDFLATSPDWKLVYEDVLGYIYVYQDSANAL